MRESHKISKYAKSLIERLRSEGFALTDDDLFLLVSLCNELSSGERRMELARGRPVAVGGAVLWPLTLAAMDWYERVGTHAPMPDVAAGYAMAHGRERDIATSTWEDVKRWFHRLLATEGELRAAVLEVLAQGSEPDAPTAKGTLSPGELSAIMVAQHGGTPEQWEHYVSCDYIIDLIGTAAAQAATGDPAKFLRDRRHTQIVCAIEQIKKRGAADGSQS